MTHHVLIVDDQKGTSRLLRSALETIEQGLIVSEAPSGEEAILDASRTRMDLLVADFRLPGINGVELMRKFRIINPDGKVIMITGVSDPRQLKQINDARPEAFFPKPVPMSDFLAAVERSLGLTRTVVPSVEISSPLPISQPEHLGVSDLLINLRKNINAQAVVLLNDMGEVAAEAGQMPAPVSGDALISALMSLFSSAQKLAGIINHSESHLHLFTGEDFDGIFLPIGSAHALFMLGKDLAEPRSLSTRIDLLFGVRLELLEAMKTMGLQVELENADQKPVSAIEEPYTRAEDLPGDFLNIFNQIGKKADDANSFWDSAVEKGTTFSEPDKLTYEQASRLGLTPDSAQDK